MKSSKVSAAFLTKFSPFLAKFKSSSTVNVAHEQIKKLFSQYAYNDIVVAFTSKMDNCDNLSDKQKKQYSKIYITLMEVYGQEIILDHYERLIQSIAKKTLGVSEIIGHLCKSLLNRIYPTENIPNYITHLLIAFAKNNEVLKIIKQIVQSFDPQLTAPFQETMMNIIGEKISQPRFKIECLEAILAIILAHEHRFSEETIVQHMIIKLFKSQDWNTRKLCVDIAYALLVINSQINSVFHEYIKQLKYDKIKHVRDSVMNYYALHKQLFGEQKKTSIKKPHLKQYISKSPSIPRFTNNQVDDQNAKSLEKSFKNTRNQGFFENAGNKDVIKISENKSSLISQRRNDINNNSNSRYQNRTHAQSFNIDAEMNNRKEQKQGDKNFENYLQKKTPVSPHQFQPKSPKQAPKNILSPKNKNYTGESFKKTQKDEKVGFSLNQSSTGTYSVSLKADFQSLKNYINQFEKKILMRLDKIQSRVTRIQENLSGNLNGKNTQKLLEQSFDRRFNASNQRNQVQSQVIESSSCTIPEESNLPDKIKESIINKNWDQAYSLALANKNKQALFELLSHETIPEDKLIQNCLLLEVRKSLHHPLVLQWLLAFLHQVQIPEDILLKLQKQIQFLPENKNASEKEHRQFWMLKSMVLNEISAKLSF